MSLGYALAYDPSKLVSANITFDMFYPSIALEHTSLVNQISCSDYYLTLAAKSQAAFDIIDSWTTTSSIAIITFNTGCNPSTERGVYLATTRTSNPDDLTFSFRARNSTWTDVAETMQITYGTRSNSACTTGNPSITSSIPKYTDRPNYDDLSAPAKALVDFWKDKLTYDSDGNILMSIAPKLDVALPEPDYQPNNATEQAALAAALDAAGLDDPASLIGAAKNSLAGNCHSKGNSNSSSQLVTPSKRLRKRISWDDVWDVGCNDFTEALLDDTTAGDVVGLACAGKDIYDNKDAIACMFTGCWNSKPADPTYKYNFDYSWLASFYFPANGKVVSWTDGSALTCVDCSYTISELAITGEITAVLATGEIKGASITVKESSKANMYFDLLANHPLSTNWSSSMSTQTLDSISVSGVFHIDPTIIFSMGADVATDQPVHITAGSGLSLDHATADIDLGTAAVSNVNGWTPSTDINNPAFVKPATVELYPYMRRLVQIAFSVMGNKISNTATLTSQTAVGFKGSLDTDASHCPENQMLLQTYLNTQQNLVFDSGFTKPLFKNTEVKPKQCFYVPNDIPTRSEVSALAAVGSEFCTSYIGYYPPISGLYTATTTTVPSTTTSTSTSTINSTPTITVTTDSTFVKTRTVLTAAYSTEAAVGTQVLASQYLKRDLVFDSMTARPADIEKRALATPSVASDWDASKLSYACSQIATGTSTVTVYTGLSTSTSGVVTETATAYTLVGASPVTSSSTNSHYTFQTTTSVTNYIPQSTSCPLQDQVSCFTLTGHGSPFIEGKQLNVRQGLANPVFDDNVGSAFYLTCDGVLVSLPDETILATTKDSANTQLAFLNDWAVVNSSSVATCQQDSSSNQLSCTLNGNNLMYAWVPNTQYWLQSWFNVAPFQDIRVSMPLWSQPAGDSDPYATIFMTYSEVTCPCADARTDQFDVIDTSNPSCPEADGTLYKAPDGSEFQIQCNTNYYGNEDSSTQSSTLESCVDACDQDIYCVGVAWTASSGLCSLKTSAASGYSSGDVHAAVRLGQKPPPRCPAGYTNGGSSGAYTIHCESGINGSFLASASEPTLGACLDWCDSWGTANCGAVTWANGYCTLYRTGTFYTVINSGFVAATR